MPTITVIDIDGNEKSLQADQGNSLMEVLRDAGYDDIVAMCGGCCSCATCHVHVECGSDAAELSRDEKDLLELTSAFSSKSRLSCQVPVDAKLDGARVTIQSAE